MARTENPFFAKNQVKFYCDDTEPKLYPDQYDEYVLKSKADAEIQELKAKLEVSGMNQLINDISKENLKLRHALQVPADEFLKGNYGIGHEIFEMVCCERDEKELAVKEFVKESEDLNKQMEDKGWADLSKLFAIAGKYWSKK